MIKMRTGLLALGVLFFIFGAVFFLFPSATTTASGTDVDEAKTQTVAARVIIPWQLSAASIITGLIFMVLGIALPDSHPHVRVENVGNVSKEEDIAERRRTVYKH